jgi:hypothetical protein
MKQYYSEAFYYSGLSELAIASKISTICNRQSSLGYSLRSVDYIENRFICVVICEK